MQPLKILVSAYACRPQWGSEPGVGWNVVHELSKHHQVVVLTRCNNRDEIEQFLQSHPQPNLRFVYCDPLWPANRLKPARIPHYYLWQISAYREAQKLIQTTLFDLIHHVTYVRYSTPSFLSLLPVPFVWGPVGGGEMTPPAFRATLPFRDKLYEWLRARAHQLGELDPFTRLTAQRSQLAGGTTEDTAQRLRQLGAKQVEVLQAIGLPQTEIEQLGRYRLPEQLPIRFITIARLLHWKGVHFGLEAFAQARLPPQSDYWIVGEGPEQSRLKQLAQALGIGDRVKFWGRLPRAETLEKLGQSSVLVHPSLHDSGGCVCLEAMAAARPVICLDTGGPSVQVIPETGYKISIDSPSQTVAELATAMSQLAGNLDLQQQMGSAGRRRIQTHFSWEVKAQQLTDSYRQILTTLSASAS